MKTSKVQAIVEKVYSLLEHLEELSANDQKIIEDLIEETHHSKGWLKHAIKRVARLAVKFSSRTSHKLNLTEV